MKRMLFVFLINLFIEQTISQDNFAEIISISNLKTTSLVFPSPVKYVDRGSKSILVHHIRQATNILLVKAEKNLQETNLTVVTEDGNLYSLIIKYDSAPPVLIYRFLPTAYKGVIQTLNDARGKADLQNQISKIHLLPSTVSGLRYKNTGLEARVKGIYVDNDLMFYHLVLINHSSIPFVAGQVRLLEANKSTGKRKQIQEIDLKTKTVAVSKKSLQKGDTASIVIVLDTYIPRKNNLLKISLAEIKGGRMLKLRLKNKRILQALPLRQFIN